MTRLREPILVVQRLGVVSFSGDMSEKSVEVYTRHLRHAWAELAYPDRRYCDYCTRTIQPENLPNHLKGKRHRQNVERRGGS